MLSWWRALPKGTQVADRRWMHLCTLAALSMTLALWYLLSHGGAAHTEETNAGVVLYTSVDSNLVQPIVEEFEKETGIHARVVGDTEATKTTGLVARLLSERAKPRADVWWSSEPLGTVSLAQAGILDPFISKAETEFKAGLAAVPAGQGQDVVRVCPAGQG